MDIHFILWFKIYLNINLSLKQILVSPLGVPPSWHLCPTDLPALFFEHVLSFWHSKMFQAHLVFSLSSNLVSKECCFLLLDNDTLKEEQRLRMLITSGVPLFLDSAHKEREELYICALNHTNEYLYLFLYYPPLMFC